MQRKQLLHMQDAVAPWLDLQTIRAEKGERPSIFEATATNDQEVPRMRASNREEPVLQRHDLPESRWYDTLSTHLIDISNL
jgi:hypothetical protein